MNLLTANRVALDVRASCKRIALRELAAKAADDAGLVERDLFEALGARERLGSTGVGEGVAIPHAKSPQIDRMVGYFVRLAEPVEFDAIDGEPVDLIFLLLAPEKKTAEHLRALAKIARALKRPDVRSELRAADDPKLIANLFEAPTEANAA